jgi:hypothetical protein
MNPWLVVFAIWFFMLVVVLLVARTARSRPARSAEDEIEESYDSDHKPNAAWRELDTQNARYGAGHPLQ